ncbi:unnamed protein product [Jaminaea pallidilutea]
MLAGNDSEADRAPVRLLLLDVFNTLLRPVQHPALQYAQVARSYDLDVSDEAVTVTFKAAFKRLSAEYPNYGRDVGLQGGADEWWARVIKETLVEAMRSSTEQNVSGDAAEQYERAVAAGLVTELLRRFAGAHGYELFDDVIPFLQQLKADCPHIKVVIASNSDARVLSACSSLGLAEWVSCDAAVLDDQGRRVVESSSTSQSDAPRSHIDGDAILSYTIGSMKPDALFFQRALALHPDAVRGDPLSAMYVGDDINEDARGAQAAGLRSLWIDRDGKFEPDEHGDVKHVRTLMEVLPLLP